jgi:tyrosyl-tRNA synthetase
MQLDDQVAQLMQGTEYGDDDLKAAMAAELTDRLKDADREKRPLRVYCGFDPRTSDLHIGHMVPIRKMRQFQEMGHEVIFLIGRFTSLVGDPSDKDQLRVQMSLDESTANAETFAAQALQILDPDNTRIEYNDTWLSPLTFAELIHIASNFTVQQFLSRETFRNRYEAADPIYLHEFFYALMQAYDAYHLETDVQIGGTDQLFNIVTAGRKLMEVMGRKPNIGVILGILPGTDGVIRMSKSLGNHIPLNTTAEDMYGKVMSVPDTAMGQYFRLATRWIPNEIDSLETGMASGEFHPRDVKMQLAKEIVSIYYGDQSAQEAELAFQRVFQEGKEPESMRTAQLADKVSLVDFMVEEGLAPSKSQARRLIDQNAVRLDDELIEDREFSLDIVRPTVLRVGKRNFLRLEPGDQD